MLPLVVLDWFVIEEGPAKPVRINLCHRLSLLR